VTGLFTSIDRLFNAVVLAQLESLDEQIAKAVRHVTSAREQLETIVLVRAKAALERPRFAKLLVPGANPAPEILRGYARLRARVRAAFAEGLRSGEIRKDSVDTVVLAAMFDGGLRTWLVERVVRSGVQPDETAIATFVAAVLDGVAAPRRGRRSTKKS
jgi:AcrR family transcriptional regulator